MAWLFPLGAYLALAVIFLLPGSMHPGRALLGYPGDNFQHAWFLWHFARAVEHLQNPFRTDLLFYPHSVNLGWSTTDPIAGLLALPLSVTAGPIVAYNVSLILQLALGAFFAYLLCLQGTGDRVAAVIGGACFGFSPFLLGEALGHLSLATAFPIPLYFLVLDRTLRLQESKWRNGVLLGAALFLTAMAHYNYTVFCALLTVVVVGVDLSLDGPALLRRIFKPLVAAAATFSVLFCPFFRSMWADPAARPHSRPLAAIEGHSADVLGWIVPSWNHVILGEWARGWNRGLFSAGYDGTVYLGPIIAALACFGIWAGWRENRRWTLRALIGAACFWALSLGPHMRVWGWDTQWPGPAYLFYLLQFGRFVSAPARFHVVMMLCVAFLAAMGIAWLLRRANGKWRLAIAAGTCALLALDLLTVPFPISTSAESARTEDFGAPVDGCQVPKELEGRTVVTVPELQWPYPDRAMWMQVSDDGRYALADGYVSYAPAATWNEYWQTRLLRSLRLVQAGEREQMDISADRQSLSAARRELNLGAIVVFNFPRRDATVKYLESVLGEEGVRLPMCTVFEVGTRIHTQTESSSGVAMRRMQQSAPPTGLY